MRLLEYQGKELFDQYGIRIPRSHLAHTVQEARDGGKKLGYPLVLKSQLTVGGRGKAGAIVKCKSEAELEPKFNELLHKEVKGELPRGILLEEMVDIKRELYLSLFLNRSKRCYSLISSAEGGIEIESAGSKVMVDILIDDNAMFRHPELKKYEHVSELEKQAEVSGFSLVELDGSIAIIGNGAGLVMSTLDMVSDAGGRAGAFLDFGGRATTETIYVALKVISKIKRIDAILVNLFGGIVKTNLVALAILNAYNNNLICVPVFARISGAESEKAKDILKGTQAKLYDTVEEAICAVVKEVSK